MADGGALRPYTGIVMILVGRFMDANGQGCSASTILSAGQDGSVAQQWMQLSPDGIARYQTRSVKEQAGKGAN